ncbi:hypothetical protein OAG24_00900 [bacterium]|nr:hypothetical protein [bacterium]
MFKFDLTEEELRFFVKKMYFEVDEGTSETELEKINEAYMRIPILSRKEALQALFNHVETKPEDKEEFRIMCEKSSNDELGKMLDEISSFQEFDKFAKFCITPIETNIVSLKFLIGHAGSIGRGIWNKKSRREF